MTDKLEAARKQLADKLLEKKADTSGRLPEDDGMANVIAEQRIIGILSIMDELIPTLALPGATVRTEGMIHFSGGQKFVVHFDVAGHRYNRSMDVYFDSDSQHFRADFSFPDSEEVVTPRPVNSPVERDREWADAALQAFVTRAIEEMD